MDSGDDGVSGSDPGTGGTGDRTEAVQPSPDSPEPSSGRRESKRRIKAAVTSPDSGDSRSDTGGPVRVLRARGPVAGRTDESKSATCQKKTESLHRGRGRPAGSRSKSAPVVYTTEKKSTSKKASKCTLGPKLSKSRKGNQRPLTRAPRTTAAAAATTTTACKPEAEIEPSSCGEEASTLNGSDSVADPDAALHEDSPLRVDDITDDVICQPETTTEKSRRQALLQQEEVKKEESDKDEEENDIKTEESPEVTMQSEDEVEDNTEPPRKRGRQQKDDKTPRPPKRRKKPPVQYVRCEIEGCGTVLAHPRYLQHHIKYQHLLKKKYVCDHPSCGRLFRLQKQLLRHAKHHTDQRDYICEFCARAFKSSHNLAVHRMIHTGEKPIQCEICGFTCRQKASLNWHMKKHDAEASYQFSCSICNRKFEKKDSVVAHKAKSHPEVLIAEAMAANGGSVINCPTSIPETVSEIVPETLPETISEAVSEAVSETVPMLTSVDQPSISQDTQKAMSSTLTPLQQVVLPLAPQTQINVSQGQFLQLPTHHVVRVGHEQQTPTLLHLTTSPPSHLPNTSHQQLIQLSTFPANTVTPMASAYPQSTLLTLSSVTTLASTANMGPQQAVQWGRETDEDVQLPGEGELWDRVVVGDSHQDVGEMMWEGNSDRRKEDEGIVWERESERQILLQCTEVQGDSLM